VHEGCSILCGLFEAVVLEPGRLQEEEQFNELVFYKLNPKY
jgi:hypothetical protein